MIYFFTGKGGVGKSTVASLFALRQASQGKKVLLVDLDPQGSLSRIFNVKKLDYKPKKLFKNIDGIAITPKLSLREYVIKRIKFSTIYDLFFDNRMLNFFLDAAPGISEIALIGKIFFLEQTLVRNKKKWDSIIVDTPATGHGLYLFKSPKVFLDIAQSGPIADQSRSIYEMLCEPSRAQINIVTIAEELPTQETIELYQQIKKMNLPFGSIFMNKLLPNDEALKSAKFKSNDTHLEVIEKIEQAILKYKTRIKIQKNYVEELEKQLNLKTNPIEWQLSNDMNLDHMQKIL